MGQYDRAWVLECACCAPSPLCLLPQCLTPSLSPPPSPHTQDNDMLEVCHGSQTYTEYASQFSTWAILASPLILGNDIRNMTPECLAIVANTEVIAVNQDALGLRGKLVLQWPQAIWPPVDPPAAAAPLGSGSAPTPTGTLALAPCNASDASQLFALSPSDGLLRSPATGTCVTYGGYQESNVFLGACTGWQEATVGGQVWAANASTGQLLVQGCPGKVADVFACNLTAPQAVQVCTAGGADCGAAAPGCSAAAGQAWDLGALLAGGPNPIPSAVAPPPPSASGPYSWCLAARPLPPPPVDIQLQVWVKPLAGGEVAFVAFNRSPGVLTVNVSWAMLGWGAGQRAVLRDLWAHASLGEFAGSWSAPVQSHGVMMVRATPTA